MVTRLQSSDCSAWFKPEFVMIRLGTKCSEWKFIFECSEIFEDIYLCFSGTSSILKFSPITKCAIVDAVY